MEFMTALELFTNACTLAMFSTGLPSCYEMVKSGNTKNVPYTMFLLGTVSCSGMLHYGLLTGIPGLAFINGVGFFLQFCYTLAFLGVTQEKSKPLSYVLVTLCYVGALYMYLYRVVIEEEEIAQHLGLSSSCITTFIMVLPLFEIIDNVRNKNGDGMPLLMLYVGVVTGCSWLLYGILLGDPFIYAPNIPGIAITLAKIYVVLLYRSDADLKRKKE